MRHTILLFAVLAWPAAHASAQTLAQQTRRVGGTIDGPGHVLSANPFLPLLGYFAAEYEQRVSPSVALALAGSHIKPDRTRYSNLDAKARLYPSETALRGFNIAASLGIARIDPNDEFDCAIFLEGDPNFTSCQSPKPFTTGSFAIEVGYQWLLGPSRVTAVTVGGGAKRYLGAESKFTQVDRVIPTLRLSIGYAF
ncbi:MAG: hypothetical protein IPP90_09025 [Gemmatimonadaceae bacterium]|nr:hypothetical protein [Gemmatimonadaceae bacterium]